MYKLIDLSLKGLTVVGAVIGFVIGLNQWSAAQKWKRMEQLDKLIAVFETDPLLRIARYVLDWTSREIKHDGATVVLRNNDALLALRDHTQIQTRPMFPPPQDLIRDSYDTFLGFLLRLEIAISDNLIEAAPARRYFAYWAERFLAMDRHPDPDGVLHPLQPKQVARKYITTYSDVASMEKLCIHFGLVWN